MIVWTSFVLTSIFCLVSAQNVYPFFINKQQRQTASKLLENAFKRNSFRSLLTAAIFNSTFGFDVPNSSKRDSSLESMGTVGDNTQFDNPVVTDINFVPGDINSFQINYTLNIPNFHMRVESVTLPPDQRPGDTAMNITISVIPIEILVNLGYSRRDCVSKISSITIFPIIWSDFYLKFKQDDLDTEISTARTNFNFDDPYLVDDENFDSRIKIEFFKRFGLWAIGKEINQIISNTWKYYLELTILDELRVATYMCDFFS